MKGDTMSLIGPWLNNVGSKKKKQKYASAEAKRRDIGLKNEWKQKMLKMDSVKLKRPVVKSNYSFSPAPPPGRETPSYPSHPITTAVAAKKQASTYTGDKMLGVSIVHKSCLQPVFSETEAKDFASMRR